MRGQWHSHHGYLTSEKSLQYPLLENINVNIVDNLGQRSAIITTVHKLNLVDIWGWTDLQKILEDSMKALHLRNKATLKGLLAGDVAKNIGLGD